jgi:ribosome recycling factor
LYNESEDAAVIDDIKADAEKKMKKSLESLSWAFNKIRTGRAHPSILDSVTVDYYGQETPLKQVASVNVEDNRTFTLALGKAAVTEDRKSDHDVGFGSEPVQQR